MLGELKNLYTDVDKIFSPPELLKLPKLDTCSKRQVGIQPRINIFLIPVSYTIGGTWVQHALKVRLEAIGQCSNAALRVKHKKVV